MTFKRTFDIVVSLAGLILLSPIFLIIAALIKLDSPGPVFFRQTRIGLGGKPFDIHKFRSMVVESPAKGPPLTIGVDPRITRTGRWLRKYKLDELPQLIDVVRGQMSLVGPRPEVPNYVEYYPPDTRAVVLSIRPGITDVAAIECRDEYEILAKSEDPERDYVEKLLPRKLEYYRRYAAERTMAGDIGIILRTIALIFR